MTQEQFLIEKCTEFKVLEARRYQESCHIYYLLDWFLKKNELGSLILIERKPKRQSDEDKKEIDSILKVNEDYHVLELKTSIRNEEDIKKTFQQLKERDDNFTWENKEIKTKFLILLCHEDNVEEVIKLYEDLISKKEINFVRPVIFLTWKVSQDTGSVESYYIKYKFGDFSEDKFCEEVKNRGIKRPIVETILNAEKNCYYFTNIKPPLNYLFFRFKWYLNQKISSIIQKPKIEETVTIGQIEELVEEIKEKMGNDLTKPKSGWIKEAIEFFKNREGGLAENNGNIEVSIQKFRKIRRGGDNEEFRHFAKILCKEEKRKYDRERRKKQKKKGSQERKLTKIKSKLGPAQKTLF